MKKLFLFFAVITVAITTSCSNDDDVSPDITTLNITISNSENYEYNLGGFGDEEGAGINIQAKHFEISYTERNPENNQIIYYYKPESNFTGTDFVEISKGYGWPNPVNSYVRINFTITE